MYAFIHSTLGKGQNQLLDMTTPTLLLLLSIYNDAGANEDSASTVSFQHGRLPNLEAERQEIGH